MYSSQRSLGRSLDSDGETATEMTEQTEEQTSLDEFDQVDDLRSSECAPGTLGTSQKTKKIKFSLINSYRSSKEERKESQAEEIKEENLPDSLNPAVKFAQVKTSGGASKSKQKYCMLCYKEFKIMSKKKQCCFCRVVVCKTCSVK